jgi:hypothetical protein
MLAQAENAGANKELNLKMGAVVSYEIFLTFIPDRTASYLGGQ